MTVIATASNPRFSVSRVDIDRGGPTYTKDTLADLHALHPDSELYFTTGADALASIMSWQGWEELFELARFVGVSRPGYELRNEHITSLLGQLAKDALTLVEIPALAISSTDCRQRAEQSRPLWYLMPDGVVQYVSSAGSTVAPATRARVQRPAWPLGMAYDRQPGSHRHGEGGRRRGRRQARR